MSNPRRKDAQPKDVRSTHPVIGPTQEQLDEVKLILPELIMARSKNLKPLLRRLNADQFAEFVEAEAIGLILFASWFVGEAPGVTLDYVNGVLKCEVAEVMRDCFVRTIRTYPKYPKAQIWTDDEDGKLPGDLGVLVAKETDQRYHLIAYTTRNAGWRHARKQTTLGKLDRMALPENKMSGMEQFEPFRRGFSASLLDRA